MHPPKEKQTSPSAERNIGVTSKYCPATLEIKGLDIKKGILLSGGTMECYYEILTVFHKDGFELIKEI